MFQNRAAQICAWDHKDAAVRFCASGISSSLPDAALCTMYIYITVDQTLIPLQRQAAAFQGKVGDCLAFPP